nr:uncharacterized protein LOC109184888 [Ipomoea batatas]
MVCRAEVRWQCWNLGVLVFFTPVFFSGHENLVRKEFSVGVPPTASAVFRSSGLSPSVNGGQRLVLRVQLFSVRGRFYHKAAGSVLYGGISSLGSLPVVVLCESRISFGCVLAVLPVVDSVGSVHPPPSSNIPKNGANGKKVASTSGSKTPWVDLFKSSKETVDSSFKLNFCPPVNGEAVLERHEIRIVQKPWAFGLLGCFAGRFPGIEGINALLDNWKDKWKVKCKMNPQPNGYVLFRFQSESDRCTILSNGPYFLYGKRLFLDSLPEGFRLDKSDFCMVPTWIRLVDLPVECWHPAAYSKISSCIGNPICMDSMTQVGWKKDYARMLVEIDTSIPPLESVPITLPNGDKFHQAVFYEVYPRYCVNCNSSRHYKEKCPKLKSCVEENVSIDHLIVDCKRMYLSWRWNKPGGDSVNAEPEPAVVCGDGAEMGDPNEEPSEIPATTPVPLDTSQSEPAVAEMRVSAQDGEGTVMVTPVPSSATESPNPHPLESDCESETSLEPTSPGSASSESSDESAEVSSDSSASSPSIIPKTICDSATARAKDCMVKALAAVQLEASRARLQLMALKKDLAKPACLSKSNNSSQPFDFKAALLSPAKQLASTSKQSGKSKNSVLVLPVPLMAFSPDRGSRRRRPPSRISANKYEKVLKDLLPSEQFFVDYDIIRSGRIVLVWNANKVDLVERRDLWAKLQTYQSSISLPWTVCGDFNTVKGPNEKIGGIVPTNYFTKDLVNCCNNLDLTDAPSVGNLFTWSNGRVKAKLDRVLIDHLWANGNFNCWVEYKDFDFISDHCPILIKLFNNSEATNRPFKFFNMWISHPSFQQILEDVWHRFIAGTCQYQFVQHLKALKAPLKRLNREEFGHISERAKAASLEFSHFAQSLDVVNATESDRSKLSDLRNRASFLAEAERQFYNQKLKFKVLIDGDKGSKYFHDLVKKSNRDKSITCILDQQGQPTTSLNQVGNLFVEHFKDLFGSERVRSTCTSDFLCNGPTLSNDLHDILLKEAVYKVKCAIIEHTGSPHLARIFLVSAFWKNKFHTALVYELLRHKANEAVCWKFTWRPCIPRKFSFILWLALWNRLKTKDRLFLPDFESDCSLCIGQKESANHLFFRCYFSQQVWSKIRESFGFPRNTIAIRSSIKWIRRLFKGSRRHSKAVYIALACTVYHLWRVRNLVIHDSVRPTLDGLVNCIATDVLRVASSVRL